MPGETAVKVCGLTNLDDAERAVDLGAWALGMVFWPHSPRRCPHDEAARIAAAMRRRAGLVGVFVDARLDTVVRAADELSLTMLQLHGDEGPSFCTEAARRTGCKIIKAARGGNAGDIRDLQRFHTDLHMLDTAAGRLRGGSGRTWEWGLLDVRRSKVPLILSGGLGPDNVAEAIAPPRPGGGDGDSGTDREPGIKDPEKVRRFLEEAAGTGAAAA